jgi:hypothetical protein
MSKRQETVDALAACLSGLTAANGYVTDLKTVREDNGTALTADEMPACLIRDKISKIDRKDYLERKTRILVKFIFADSEDIRSRMRTALSEAYRIIGSDEVLGGEVGLLTPVSDKLMIETETNKIGTATIKFSAAYETTLWED